MKRGKLSYKQWKARKRQWDEDWAIRNGGPSTETLEELQELPTWLECHNGAVRPKTRQSISVTRDVVLQNPVVGSQHSISGAYPVCNRTFGRTCDLNRHIKGHTQGSFLSPARKCYKVCKRKEQLRDRLQCVHCWEMPRKVLKEAGPDDAEQVHDEE